MTEDFRFLNLMNEFLAVLGLRCCVGFSFLWEAGATLVALHGLLVAVDSLVVGYRL